MNIVRRPSGVMPSRHVESTELSKNLPEFATPPALETGCSMRRVTAAAPRLLQAATALAMSLSTCGQCSGRTTDARSTGLPRKSRTSTVPEELGVSLPRRCAGGRGSGCTARTHSLPRGTTRPGQSCGQKRLGLAVREGGAGGAAASGLEGTGVPMYCTGPTRDVPGVPMKWLSGGSCGEESARPDPASAAPGSVAAVGD
mmetsp:Transcript_123140/g.383376  ORF Transcript_123140/g.383376 Transcript_123140/m.383376 type:complete len:200 (-) Transcript_123140:355-954(-)